MYTYDRTDAARPRDLATEHALWQSQLEAAYLQEKLGDKSPTQIVRTLSHRYAQQLRAMQDLHPDEVAELYLDTLAHVYDPHSDFLGHEQSETFSIAMNLSLAGIGATLESSEDGCTIRALVPGSPAARSGALHPGDRIVAVAQGVRTLSTSPTFRSLASSSSSAKTSSSPINKRKHRSSISPLVRRSGESA